ncbi:MAG TPA: lytic transglycosylase domain-containing protein [Clostridiales bacterium]|nr:lytic transglycosylase domain-containing protein [Clostridiales bacterium]
MKKGKFFVAALLIGFLYLLYALSPDILKYVYPIKYKGIIARYAAEYNLDLYLIAAIIKVESNYNVTAKSNKGAIGLMQIKPSTGEWIGNQLRIKDFEEEMLYDPEINIKMGCWYINYLIKYYNDNKHLALAAYNGGQGNVNKWLKDEKFSDDGITLKNIPFEETRRYIQKVNKVYNIYKKVYR